MGGQIHVLYRVALSDSSINTLIFSSEGASLPQPERVRPPRSEVKGQTHSQQQKPSSSGFKGNISITSEARLMFEPKSPDDFSPYTVKPRQFY